MDAHSQPAGFDFISLIPLLILMIPFAIGFTLVAGRIGRNRVVWAVLSLVPFVNYLFWVYAWFVILLYVIDKLNAISGRIAAPAHSGQAAS